MKPLYIAEVGINHDGDYNKAKKLIDHAVDAGADIAKFQYYDPLKLLGSDSPYLEYAQKCQLTKDEHEQLAKYCDTQGIEYAVSVFDVNDLDWCNSISSIIKVASRMNRNSEFLAKALTYKKQVIMSIQGPPLSALIPNLYYMFCVTQYPAAPNEYLTYPHYSGLVGLSSHCPSGMVSLYGALKGARIFENHLTISRQDEGCDHAASIEPHEYKAMIRDINAVC